MTHAAERSPLHPWLQLLWLVPLFVACADDATERVRDDASAVARDDAGSSASDQDAQPTALDAQVDAGVADAQTPADGALGQADAQVDAALAYWTNGVCGDRVSWPHPLPSVRAAKPINTTPFGFIEGPLWFPEYQVLLFSDMRMAGDMSVGPYADVRRLTGSDSFDVAVGQSYSNGLAVDPKGGIYGATHNNQGLSMFDLALDPRGGSLTVRTVDNKRLNSPNDLTFRSDGTVYLTDPDWQLGTRTSETGITGVYRIAPPLKLEGTNTALLVDGTLNKPNGIALSPDERTLYVSSLGAELWSYPVNDDGSLGKRALFASPGASDGMTVDCAGNVYVTTGGVKVFSRTGQPLGEITLAETATNVAFGGADRKTLYITANKHLYSIALNVPGAPY